MASHAIVQTHIARTIQDLHDDDELTATMYDNDTMKDEIARLKEEIRWKRTLMTMKSAMCNGIAKNYSDKTS